MIALYSRHLRAPNASPPALRAPPRLAFASALLAVLAILAILVVGLPGLALASLEGELAYDRAVSAYEDGDLVNARQGFERVLQEDPDDAGALHYLSRISIAQGEIETGIEQLEQLVAQHPSVASARVDLAIQYLKGGRDEEALEQLDAAVELEPDNPLALLCQGIALYRLQILEAAIESLERAAELDPGLSSEASYYVGLSNSYLGADEAAASAFDAAAIGSPESPLGRSATKLRRLAARSARPWSFAATIGLEYNDNLRLSSDKDISVPLVPQADTGKSKSGAGVAELQGLVEVYSNEIFSWRVGYDGSLLLYWDDDDTLLTAGRSFSATDLSEQTHVAWTNATIDTRFASLALRYDFSYTALDLTDSFRTIQRVAPTVYVPISQWGLFLAFYQFLYYDYDYDGELRDPDAFDRTGPQHSIGARQFVFLPDPIDYLVIGTLVSTYDADGTEFRHDAVEVSVGGEMSLPWMFSAGVLYRYSYRDYSKVSKAVPIPPTKREDNEHEVSFSLDRTFASQYNLSVSGSYTHNSSNIDNFDISRFIIGTYLRYSF